MALTENKTSTTMSWKNYRGNTITREINHLIDVRDFLGTPGFSSLVVAANTHLSASDIAFYLSHKSHDTPFVERSLSWIKRRRWMFQQPGTDNTKGSQPDADGKQAVAVQIMRANPKSSVRELARLLKDNGIKRSSEWVRRHRCDAE